MRGILYSITATISRLFFIGFLLLHISCAQASPPETLKIKNLYLGMKIDSAPPIVKSLLPNADFTGIQDVPTGISIMGFLSPPMGIPDLGLLADRDKRTVTFIAITNRAGDILFNSADMDLKTFAETFANAYKLPLKFGHDDKGRPEWAYTSPHGYNVIITEDKGIIIRAIAKSNERKFD